MYSFKALLENSTKCFVMAKSRSDIQEDHLRAAAVTLIQAVLYKAVGNAAKGTKSVLK